MGDPSRVRVFGPLESYAPGFRVALSRQGYTSHSAACQLRLMAHVSRWLAAEGLDAMGLTAAGVEAFLAARRAAGYVQWCSVKALVPLLGYLRGLGVVAEPVARPPTPVEALLGRYRSYLLGERGLAAATARGYVDMVRPFVAGRVTAGGGLDLVGLVPGDVTRFVLGACVARNRGSAKLMVTALRSLLGFLHVDGVTAGSLVSAVPSVASWRLAGLPRGLEAGQVRRLLASCDRRSMIGRRDVAILTLLVRLGLRAGEAARLGLDDIDWAAGEITVDGKGPRRERLPVPVDVGEAVVGYLRRGRPHDAEARTLFVTVRAHTGR